MMFLSDNQDPEKKTTVSTFIPPYRKELGDKDLQDQMGLCFIGELFFHISLQRVADFAIPAWEPYTQEYFIVFLTAVSF